MSNWMFSSRCDHGFCIVGFNHMLVVPGHVVRVVLPASRRTSTLMMTRKARGVNTEHVSPCIHSRTVVVGKCRQQYHTVIGGQRRWHWELMVGQQHSEHWLTGFELVWKTMTCEANILIWYKLQKCQNNPPPKK